MADNISNICTRTQTDALLFFLRIEKVLPDNMVIDIGFPISWQIFSLALALSYCEEKPYNMEKRITIAKYIESVDGAKIKVLIQDGTHEFSLQKDMQETAKGLREGDIIKIEFEDKFGMRFASRITKLF